MSRATVGLLVGLVLLLGVPRPSEAGAAPDKKCQATKAKQAGKKAAALLKALGKNISKNPDTKLAANISKAESKFSKGFSKAEAKGGCLTNGDSQQIEDQVNAFVADVVAATEILCGNQITQVGEECDGTDDSACPGACQPDCTCPVSPDVDGDGFTVADGDCDDGDAATFPGAPELCDGKDNDCDLQVDEGNPGGGGPCSTGLPGVCAAGTLDCSGGSAACVQDVPPSAEICDGLDNDCDGAVDEGCFPIGSSCTSPLECAGGHCIDGVCCDGACAGLCESCLASETGGTDGVCAFVLAGTDPAAECPGSSVCDGAGLCQ